MSNISITHSHPCQRQPFGDVLREKCSEIIQHIYRRTRIYNMLIFSEVYFYHGGCFRGFFKLEATTSQTDDFKINFKALLTPDISVIILIQCFKSYTKKQLIWICFGIYLRGTATFSSQYLLVQIKDVV